MIASRGDILVPFCIQVARVLIVMAVEAQQLPIAAIRGIVVVIVIFMVDGKLPKLLAAKFPAASGADPWQDLKSLFPVTLVYHLMVSSQMFCLILNGYRPYVNL